jgi:hypothetical protein
MRPGWKYELVKPAPKSPLIVKSYAYNFLPEVRRACEL